MTFSDIHNTASAWYNGMGSSLYSFLSTETIHGEQHRDGLKDEIRGEILDISTTDEILYDERVQLEALLMFVQTAPTDMPLGSAMVGDDGMFICCDTPADMLM